MIRFCLWFALLCLGASCSSEATWTCDICGESNGKHRVFEKVPAVLDKIAKLEGGDRLVRQIRSMGGSNSTMVCPRVFGELPAPGTVRILAPESAELTADRQVWTWILIRARPFEGAAARGTGLTVRCGPPGKTVGITRDHVWIVTLEVDRQRRDFGPVARLQVINRPASGGSRTTAGISANIPADATLDQLVVVNRGETIAQPPARVLLASVDGNPITIDLVTDKPATGPKPLRAWEQWFKERIYAGRQPSDQFDPEPSTPPQESAPVTDEAQATARATAYLAHHEVKGWSAPVRVTRTALNHFRVEFAPNESGRDRALIVDPKNGDVDHPRHPR